MAFELPILASGVAIVDKKGNPTPQFMLFWQRTSKSIQSQEAGQEELLSAIQQQQLVIAQLLVVVAQNVGYLNELSEYMLALSTASNARLVYTQCATGLTAANTGTDISTCGDPGSFPLWPGDPPLPPWEDPGP